MTNRAHGSCVTVLGAGRVLQHNTDSHPPHLGLECIWTFGTKAQRGPARGASQERRKKKKREKKTHGCKGRALVEDSTYDVHAATRFVIRQDPFSAPAHGRHALVSFLYLHFLFRAWLPCLTSMAFGRCCAAPVVLDARNGT